MAKGIIYVMSTVVPGLIKIGKTGKNNFESRMYNLERNGYSNVTGLRRKFAIEVNDYDEKEALLDDIFSKSRVPNTELFALDLDLVIQLLSSFEGLQIYPSMETKEQVFTEATKKRRSNEECGNIPEGTYFLNRKVKGFGLVKAAMEVKDGNFIVLKGSTCAPSDQDRLPECRKNAQIKNNILQQNVICHSPSTAGSVVIGKAINGWKEWKDQSRQPLDIYRFKPD
ncbi:DUF4357 domain-containing protein [Dubosiella newyorkensis]|uniref:Bacteriophage T5 Orf172 DNA-binding domain-containing protein n=1 Tax=Dubosiella newyorkensis TaxID=1862672 RepID=A0A1U7NM22_9FIRM|nr:DUF4357 domain-containing protein [Dubosiella newyorkensis]OLU46183.1 hypothetical protein BO225_06805 [Dubosiella newyorkensis]